VGERSSTDRTALMATIGTGCAGNSVTARAERYLDVVIHTDAAQQRFLHPIRLLSQHLVKINNHFYQPF